MKLVEIPLEGQSFLQLLLESLDSTPRAWQSKKMAASWLLQAIYTSLLTSAGDLSGMAGGSSPATATSPGQIAGNVLANTTAGILRGKVDNSEQPTIFRYLGVPFAKPPLGKKYMHLLFFTFLLLK